MYAKFPPNRDLSIPIRRSTLSSLSDNLDTNTYTHIFSLDKIRNMVM